MAQEEIHRDESELVTTIMVALPCPRPSLALPFASQINNVQQAKKRD